MSHLLWGTMVRELVNYHRLHFSSQTNQQTCYHRCPVDPSVRFHPTASPTVQRFSVEAFKFLGNHHFVFIHCRIYVCDSNDPNSRCAQGCKPVGGNGNHNLKLLKPCLFVCLFVYSRSRSFKAYFQKNQCSRELGPKLVERVFTRWNTIGPLRRRRVNVHYFVFLQVQTVRPPFCFCFLFFAKKNGQEPWSIKRGYVL